MKASDAKRLKDSRARTRLKKRACRAVGQHRSTQYLDPPEISDEERQLREFLRTFSKRRPRWGWRRAAKEARRAGWEVNGRL
jgi:putative transposase